MTSDPDHRRLLNQEFERAADVFAARTKGRFDDLGVVEFARSRDGETVLEVGVGTGVFLSLFRRAGVAVGVDLTLGMLRQARRDHPHLMLVAGDGARLPLRTSSVDLATSAQMLHHVDDPLGLVRELRRVIRPDGRVLIVDQVATERFEEATAMTVLEKVRDPSHVSSRPPSAFRTIVRAAGLDIVDERLVEGRQRFSQWMWRGEFPDDRIASVQAHIARHGGETGMAFEREGEDWTFVRKRIMLLAKRT